MVFNKTFLWAEYQVISIFIDTDNAFIRELVKSTMKEVDAVCGLKFKFVNRDDRHDVAMNAQYNPDAGTYCLVGTANKHWQEHGQTQCVLGSASQVYYDDIKKTQCFIDENLRWQEREPDLDFTSVIKFYQDDIVRLKNVARSHILHETFHMLGFLHEQYHPNSGIMWERVDGVMESYKSDPYDTLKYDPLSITHYPSTHYSNLVMGEVAEVPWNYEMSKLDIKALQTLYGTPDKKWERGLQEFHLQ